MCILLSRGLSRGYKLKRLEHWNSSWRLDALTIARGQGVMRLEAKDLLLDGSTSWQAHTINVFNVCVESDVMQVGPSVKPIVVCRGCGS